MTFEIGQAYEIHFLENSRQGPIEKCTVCEVVSWWAPLLKVKQSDGDVVFNTHSMLFLWAQKHRRASEQGPVAT